MFEALTKEQKDNYNLLFNTVKTLNTVEALRHSKGFYSRLFEAITDLSESELYEFVQNLPKFNDSIDVILYFEQ